MDMAGVVVRTYSISCAIFSFREAILVLAIWALMVTVQAK